MSEKKEQTIPEVLDKINWPEETIEDKIRRISRQEIIQVFNEYGLSKQKY